MNSLLSMLSGMGGGGNSSILFQALGAAMRGESPQQFMKKLANSDPRLKKMNLDDLMGSAQQLAQERGVNLDDVAKQIDTAFEPRMK
jgi:hypothetical protein